MRRQLAWHDHLLSSIEQGLRAIAAQSPASNPSPAASVPDAALTLQERRRSAALMRVNHAGELAAQALYSGQSLAARAPDTREHLLAAAAEERDHLAWCAERIRELGGRPSLLAPLWYAGSFLVGCMAGIRGDAASLGFVAETERQVEAHLNDHLARLPAADARSAAILRRMADDERHHGTTARLAGGVEPPAPVRFAMACGGGLLRRLALHL